jgi:hypothetical protein
MLKTLEIIFVVIMVISVMRMLNSLPKRACGHYNDKEIVIRFFIDALPLIISIAGIITINVI